MGLENKFVDEDTATVVLAASTQDVDTRLDPPEWGSPRGMRSPGRLPAPKWDGETVSQQVSRRLLKDIL